MLGLLMEFYFNVDENMSIFCSGAERVVYKHKTTGEQPEDELSSETLAGKVFHDLLNIYKHNKHIKHSFIKKNKKMEEI